MPHEEERPSPVSFDSIPLNRAIFSVFIAAAVGSFPTGYALGFPSTALVDLGELQNDRVFRRGRVETQLFVVSLKIRY